MRGCGEDCGELGWSSGLAVEFEFSRRGDGGWVYIITLCVLCFVCIYELSDVDRKGRKEGKEGMNK